MRTIEIKQENIITGCGHSSKGNQLKWEIDGWWYKADAFGYESLAEVMVSRLLAKSSLTDDGLLVTYEPVEIIYKGKKYRGCRSKNFKGHTQELIPLERLARISTGFGLARELARIADVQEKIAYTAELVQNLTGLEQFGTYLTKILEIDAFFLNEDRHTNNVAVLYDVKTKEYQLCPYFDMGLSLFSDTKENFGWEKEVQACQNMIEAKPFSKEFDIQLDAANERYGQYLKFNCTAQELMREAEHVFQEGDWTTQEKGRVQEVLRCQIRKYGYMLEH